MKAARMAALCWVFSIVQRKDRPSGGTVPQGSSAGGTGRLPGKPERNAVPTKGDIMAISQAGNGFPASEDEHHIFFVHTAVPSKGAAGFFYSTHFYFILGHITKGYVVFGSLPFRGRAPPPCSLNCLTLPF